MHPETSRYTCRRRSPNVQCRLDFFLISQSVANITALSDIHPGYKSDHSMIILKLSLHSNSRGPGLWKLNASSLTEIDYINQIKETIRETLDEYRDDDFVNPSLLWEMIKLKVCEKSLSYAKHRKKQTKQHEMELEQSIAKLEEKLMESQTSHLEDEIDKQELEYEKIIEYRTKSAILRSKAKWYNEGEKNTKYFLSLEKRHFKESTISHIKVSDNAFINSDGDILCESTSFYKNLYESKATVTNFLDTSAFFDTAL